MIGPSSEADSCRSEAAALPRTPSEVIQAMRSSSAEAFSALRHSSESARALHPSPDSLPPTLPAFVLPSHTLLPNDLLDAEDASMESAKSPLPPPPKTAEQSSDDYGCLRLILFIP